MEKIEIKNLRSIVDSKELELNSLNIFMGANSTGKSSILRMFQLFKQTTIKKKSGPILWYDIDGVDFGSFDESVNFDNKEEGISFAFSFEIDEIARPLDEILFAYETFGSYDFNMFPRFSSREKKKEMIRLEFLLKKNTFSEIKIKSDDYPEVSFNLDRGCISVNKTDYHVDGLKTMLGDYELVPSFYRVKGKRSINIKGLLIQSVIDEFESVKRKNAKNENIFKLLKYESKISNFYENISREKNQITIINKLNEDIGLKNRIYDYTLMIKCLDSLQIYNETLANYFKNVIYIAPIRASAERYYRIQGLSVDEVDSMGSNVAMILYSMIGTKSYDDWQKWTLDNFDICYYVDGKGGHAEIKVKTQNGQFNLADTGFGYSQLLPILLILWKEDIKESENNSEFFELEYLSFKNMSETEITVVIEQPELHLHPALQAKMGDLLVKMINNNNKIKFIIETHSISLIDRIGEHIEYGNVSGTKEDLENKVNIYLVNPIQKESDCNIVSTKYDEFGVIQDWPVGFLSGGML